MGIANNIKFEYRGVSTVVGSILMVVVTLILSVSMIQFIYSLDEPEEKTFVELIANMDLKNPQDGGGGTIGIMHKGGDSLENNKTLIYINIDDNMRGYNLSNSSGWEDKEIWNIGEKWSIYFQEITVDSEVKVTVIENVSKEILLKGRVQSGVSFPDFNAPIISIAWCDPVMALQDGSVSFKIYATIIDSENNLPDSGTVTLNLLPISGNDAEPMFDFDKNGIYETQSLWILNGTDVGMYSFEITALDSYGNKGVGDVILEVGSLDTIHPTVEITKPTVNAFVNSTPLIVGGFSDNVGGTGIDTSSISLKIDNEDITIDPSNITTSSVTYLPETQLTNGTHTTTLIVKDKAGNQASTSLTFITGGYKEPYGVGGAQNFIILDQSGVETTYFEPGEMVRIRVSSSIVENAETKNRITIYDSDGNSSVIDPAFTLISNTAPYLFYDYSYACVFDAPSSDYYKIKLELIDSNGNKFSAQANLTVGAHVDSYYFKTYEDSNYMNESKNFYSSDIVYVNITANERGQVNNTNSDNIYVEDYILNNQIQDKPGEGAISDVQMASLGGGHANYKFSINLSMFQYGWLQSENWYTLSIQGLKNNNNDLIFKGAIQINVINTGKPDLEVDENDIFLSNDNPTLRDNVDISVIVHNIGIVNAIDVLVEVWDGTELISQQTIPLISPNGGDEEITIQWIVRNQNSTTLIVIVDPDYSINEYDETNNLASKLVTIRYPILLVDDDDGDGEAWNIHIQDYWNDSLDNGGYYYSLYTVPSQENGPDFNYMKNYDVVIWFTGRDNFGTGATLTSIDQTNIAMYLEDGGNFWIISQSLIYVMCGFSESNPLNNAFASQYLQVNERIEDVSTKDPILGVEGDPITDGMSYNTSSTIFNGDDYCDDLLIEPDGAGIFHGDGLNYSAVRYSSDTFKTVFFAFEFIFIEDENDREELVGNVLDWFGIHPIENDVGISSLFCPDNIEINTTFNVTATIKNYGTNNQTDFEVLCTFTAQNGTIVYNNTKTLSLDSGNETQLTWSWTPHQNGIYIVYVSTLLNLDEDNSNNESTAQMNVIFFYDNVESGQDGWISNGTTLVPLFQEDFEDGNLNDWEIDQINDGGVVTVSNSEAYNGTYCAKFYGDHSGSNEMWIQRLFNLTGMSNIYLTWNWHDEDLEVNEHGYISIYDGEWHDEIVIVWDGHDEDHSTSKSDYEQAGDPMIIRLDSEYNMIDNFIIRFGARAKHNEESDCLLLDNIKLTGISSGTLWHITNTRSNSGNSSFWCGDDNTTKYVSYTNNSLISPLIDLGNATSAKLIFWQYCDFEETKDGGIVEISIDNGSSWTQITPIGGYDGTINEPTNSLDGKEAFNMNTNEWVNQEININAYIGNEIKIRFRFGSSASGNKEGWYIDDIAIIWGN